MIYVYADLGTDRLLNVGHTGQRLRSRLKSYRGWLNGLRAKENNRPIRLSWLECLAGSSRVEVWAKTSLTDRAAREAEETEWIQRPRPILNVSKVEARVKRGIR